MDFEQLKELIYFLQGTNVSRISVEQSGLKIEIEMKAFASSGRPAVYQQPIAMPMVSMPVAPVVEQAAPVAVQQPVAPVAPAEVAKVEAAPAKEEKKAEANYLEIKSPMVGTFYRSPAPDKPAFVKVGDMITPDSPVCLIEAMKLFNEVKAEISGRIVKVLLEDGNPVEYDQVLFLVEPA